MSARFPIQAFHKDFTGAWTKAQSCCPLAAFGWA